MRSFEIQIYRDGKWKMDSVYDNRIYAVEEAKRADESGRHSGIRVIEENYDEDTNETTTRTLFRGGVAKGQKGQKPVPTASSRKTASRGSAGQEPGQRSRNHRQTSGSNHLVSALVLIVVLLAGVAALLGLKHLSAFL